MAASICHDGRDRKGWKDRRDREGLPEGKLVSPSQTSQLVVVDDLMAEADSRLTKLFTKGSHHSNTSVVHLVQNLFDKKTDAVTISRNTHYMVVFKNPRDASQITHLARQMYPSHVKFMQEAFADATAEPYGYLFIDLKQETPDHLRLRTHVLPGETQYVYLRKS